MPSFERLPRHIVPVHYDLWLKPDLAGFSFTGSVRIHLRVEKAGNDVVKLNVNELDVQSVAIKEGAGKGKGKPTPEVKEFKVSPACCCRFLASPSFRET